MRIIPVLQHNNTLSVKNFGATNSFYVKKEDSHFTENKILRCTCAFREDLDWKKFVELLDKSYNDKKKVNIYCLACSDGSEAYSLAMALESALGNAKAKKFLPIKAFDQDKTVLDFAKKGKLNLSKYCINRIEKHVLDPSIYLKKAKENISLPDETTPLDLTTYNVKERLKNSVVFNQGKLEDVIKNLKDDGNTVVMCRNVFPYFNNNKKVMQIIDDASANLKAGSLFVIGHFDEQTHIGDYLSNNKFWETERFVYKKIEMPLDYYDHYERYMRYRNIEFK